ncbi:cation-translocating P-type ATPase [Candidatus Pacearchaeota archaeon]|nr:cation-translocating P-type ATPase [Candidatus Pacearchaeota archaeon]
MGDAYLYDSSKVVSSFGSDVKNGLTEVIASQRLKDFGLNEIKRESNVSALVIFFRQFKSFIIYLLIFALIVSTLLGEYVDSIVIFAILILNATFGFVQEYRAEKSIEALKKLSSLKAKVIRNGELREIDSTLLVPGDIIMVEDGDKVPADARVIESFSLSCLESSLTGESSPTGKHSETLKGNLVINDQKNMIFSGTLVTNGRGKCVVTGTGMRTELGKIAHLLEGVEKEATPLQIKLDKFGKFVGLGVIFVSIMIFLIGFFREGLLSELIIGDYSRFFEHVEVWLITAIALAVAAVPEGLPAVVTISLAIGVKRLLRKNSLIRRLPSVETLGETNVICCDKTGTLTKNEMTVRNIFVNKKDYVVSGEDYSDKGLISMNGKQFSERDSTILNIGALCNNAVLHKENATITGDPTEAALLVSALKGGIDYKILREKFVRVDEIPFDASRKMMSTLHKNGKEFLFYTKGAPERVLDKCSHILVDGRVVRMTEKMKKEILDKNKSYASQALRVLGFAYKIMKKKEKMVEKELIFVGLQGMIDPPKIEIKDYMERTKTAGIRVIMITGDNINTANAIARDIGLTGEAIEGIHFSMLGNIEKRNIIKTTNIFARVEPAHKLEILKLLQESGAVVAMTGDGVNDAPALKSADLGIAMGIKGSDVSKEASDMVLTDDNFSTIVSAVEEGRGIYSNILSFVKYLLSSNLAEVMIVVFAILFGLPLPFTALMLLWINLVTDGLPALALSVDPYPRGMMNISPRNKNEPILTRSRLFSMFYMSILITAGVLGLFVWSLSKFNDLAHAQTIVFTSVVVFELVRAYIVRKESNIPTFSNFWLLIAVLTSFGLQLLVLYTPLGVLFDTVALSLSDWSYIAVTTFAVFVLSLIGLSIQNKFENKTKPFYKVD